MHFMVIMQMAEYPALRRCIQPNTLCWGGGGGGFCTPCRDREPAVAVARPGGETIESCQQVLFKKIKNSCNFTSQVKFMSKAKIVTFRLISY